MPRWRRAWPLLVVGVLALCVLAVLRVRKNASIAQLRHGEVSRSDRTVAEVDPHVTFAEGGLAAVSFMGVSHVEGEGDAARFVGTRLSRDRGASWEELAELRSPEGRFATDSMLASDGRGGIVCTWLGFHQRLAKGGEPYDLEIYMARSDAGGPFGEPRHVTKGVRGDDKFLRVDKPWTARLGNGTLATSYRVEGATGARIQVSRTKDASTFEHVTVEAGRPFGGTLATICGEPSGAHAWVAWVDASHGTFAEVVLRSSEDSAVTFPDDRRVVLTLPDEHAVVEAPQCVADADALFVAYGVGSQPPDDSSSAAYDGLVIVRSRDRGRTFDARWQVREPGQVLLHPALALLPNGDLGVLALVGKGDGDTHGSVRRFELRRDGTPVGPSTVVQDGVRLVRKRAPLAGWTGDFLGFAADGDRELRAFGVNGGDTAGAAHVVVR